LNLMAKVTKYKLIKFLIHLMIFIWHWTIIGPRPKQYRLCLRMWGQFCKYFNAKSGDIDPGCGNLCVKN
jgi:hypothetical protein